MAASEPLSSKRFRAAPGNAPSRSWLTATPARDRLRTPAASPRPPGDVSFLLRTVRVTHNAQQRVGPGSTPISPSCSVSNVTPHPPREVIRLALERTGSQNLRELSEKTGVSEVALGRFRAGEKPPTQRDLLAIFGAAGLVAPRIVNT